MATKDSLQAILGKADVIDDPGILASYAVSHSFGPHYRPWYAVKPGDAETVEKLVGWANKTGTPLVPVSSTGVKLRGTACQACPGRSSSTCPG